MDVGSQRQTYTAIVKRWWLTIIWAAVIFFFSTDYFSAPHTTRFLTPFLAFLFPAITPAQIEFVHLLVRKFGHFSEYFVFALLLMRAFQREANGSPNRRSAFWTLLIVLAYAASDEFHQSFVASRSATLKDVIIDFTGGLVGTIWICWRNGRRRPRFTSSNNAGILNSRE